MDDQRLLPLIRDLYRDLRAGYRVRLSSYPNTLKFTLPHGAHLEVASGNQLVRIDHLTLSLDIDRRIYLGYHNVLSEDEIQQLAEAEVQTVINQASGRGEELSGDDIARLRDETQTHYRENDTLVHVTDRPQQSWAFDDEGIEAGMAAIAAILDQC